MTHFHLAQCKAKKSSESLCFYQYKEAHQEKAKFSGSSRPISVERAFLFRQAKAENF